MSAYEYVIFGGVCGWVGGALGMWAYFATSGLIRTREEYYAAKRGTE